MRSPLLTLIGFLLYASAFAQIVELDPPFPNLDEEVTITYYATEGNAELEGVSPVYMHSGLIIAGQSGWQNVVGNWGTPDPNVLMDEVAPNVHQISIVPTTFYGVSASADVEQFAFVFRDAAGNLVGRAANGADIFVTVQQGLPQVMDPPAGVVDGINYISDESVILQLFAPGKDYVYVIGDFNNWQLSPEYFCKKTNSGDRFWLQIDGLMPGQEYRFQYSIDEEDLRVADIYAEKILDPWNDNFIGSDRYPGLISYPFGLTNEIVSVLQTAKEPYNWEVENFFRPPLDRMVIYELLVRDFTEQGTFQGVIDRLDYLQELGVNALELMPVNEFEGNESWGYNPSFYFAADKYYGPSDKLKELVDECHKRGIAVILDVVFNHSFGQNPQVRMYSENGAAGPVTPDNPWFNVFAKHPFSPGFDYNHDSPHTQEFVKRALQFWITEYKIDGYRFDLSKGFTQNDTGSDIGAWSAYDQSRVDHWLRIRSEIHEVDSEVYLILEHFSDNSEETALANAGFMLWGNNHFSFTEAGMGYQSNLNGANYQLRGWAFPNLVSYAESHDEERLMYNNINFGNSSNSAHDASDKEIALQRMEAIAAFNIPILGPKMIWQFGELGYDFSINYCPADSSVDPSCRTANKPVRWDYYQDADRNRLYKVYAAINKLKTENEAFSSTNYNYDVWGFGKRHIIEHSSMDVVIIANFDVQPLSMVPGFTKTGVWYDYFTGGAIIENDLNNAYLLEPGEYRIYTSEPLPTPDLGFQEVEVTFRVDMSLQNIDMANGGVGISGSFNNFAFQPMADEGDGIYSYTVTLDEAEEIEYKFRNGQAFENISGACASGSFGNRQYMVTAADVSLPVVCYESCEACPSEEDLYTLSFQVDGSQVSNLAASGIHIAGTFNSFSPEPMNDLGDGLYGYSATVLAGSTVQWKYTNGPGFSGQEDVPASCGTADGFGGFNRIFVMPAANVLQGPVCFSACAPCEDEPLCEANGGVLEASGSRSFCVGTGVPKGISVQAVGAVGSNQRWALIDAGGDIVAVRSNNSNFNLDQYAPGNYSIRYIRFEDDVSLAGISNISQAASLEGCFSIASNAINLFLRDEPNGGQLSALSPTQICANSGAGTSIELELTGADGENGVYGIVADALNNAVVASQPGPNFNLNGLDPGQYRAFHLSYQQGVSLVGVQSAGDLQGCFDLSNPVVFSIVDCAQATLSSQPKPSSGPSLVQFSLAQMGRAVLEIYDLSGRRIDKLFEGDVEADREYQMHYDTSHLPNGVYLYRLQSGDVLRIDKLVVAH